MNKTDTNKELVVAKAIWSLKSGDYSGFNVIYEENFDAIYAFHRRKVFKEPAIAEDLTSETFIKFLLSLDRYTHSNSYRLKSFLYSIAFRVFVDYYRKNNKVIFTEIDDTTVDLLQTDSSAITKAIDDKTQKQAIFSALNRIDPKYKRVIELFYLQELSYKEIQNELNLPSSTIKVHLNRARQLLRSQMKRSKIFGERLELKLTTS